MSEMSVQIEVKKKNNHIDSEKKNKIQQLHYKYLPNLGILFISNKWV